MTDIVTLKQLCTQLKLGPRAARKRLRATAHDRKKHPRTGEAAQAPPPVVPGQGISWGEWGATLSL